METKKSQQRFTEEFKVEAVKQVTEKGFAVAEVVVRLGVSAHSLYSWIKPATTPQRAGRGLLFRRRFRTVNANRQTIFQVEELLTVHSISLRRPAAHIDSTPQLSQGSLSI